MQKLNALASRILDFAERWPFVFFLLFSVSVLLMNAASSPLLGYNPMPSPNMFLTIGQGIFDGLVPYRDLWDGKGFAVFFFVGLFGKLFPGIYFGHWLLSCLSMALTGAFLFRLAMLVSGRADRALLPSVLAWGLSLYQGRMFILGGASDEYIMPLIALALYLGLLSLQSGLLKRCQWLLLGMSFGLIFWMKFTLCSVPLVFLVAYAVFFFREERERVCRALGYFVLGLLIITLPILGYYIANGACDSLYYGYYEFHRLYHPHSGVKHLCYNLLTAGLMHPSAVFILLIGLWSMLRRNRKIGIVVSLSCIVLTLGTYMGSAYHYYFLALIPFTIFGMCALTEGASSCARLSRYVLVLIVLVSSSPLYPLAEVEPNLSRASVKSRKQEIQAIAEFCAEHKDSSVIYFGLMESGLYHQMHRYPEFLYYQQVNVDPVGAEAQKQYVRDRKSAFLILARRFGKDRKEITETDEHYRWALACGYKPVNRVFSESPFWILMERE